MTYAGRGVMPRAVAMAIDHCFTTAGLHRIEVCIRPENTNSLRVVEKLGIREIGYAPLFLHIDGEWRDHRIYAITKEEVPAAGCSSGTSRRVEPAPGSGDLATLRIAETTASTARLSHTSNTGNLRHTGRHPRPRCASEPNL